MIENISSAPTVASTIPSKKSRIIMASVLFVVLIIIYGFIFLFGAGITYLEKACRDWMEYYIIGVWPAVILFWIVVPCWMILIGKNARYYIACLIVGALTTFAFYMGYFMINQIFCG